ncbi:MAG: aspartate--ammonia ligase [Tissierellia bacterium]|nr:aspartate--ammonia ligase [Tissierellia bacterium]
MRNNSLARELDIRETQIAIKTLKDFFQRDLANTLNLTRVSAPLFVTPSSGLNDRLSGVERPVSFSLGQYDMKVEIVQSLAKWKRYVLKRYGFGYYEGLYADMNAIRADEVLDSIHSVYVDQWDWEKIIRKEDRNASYLKFVVNQIYSVFKRTENYINSVYPFVLSEKLPEEITFISSQELEDMYPDKSPKEREELAAKKYGAYFLMGIGHKLSSGEPHDLRSPDYDDWSLNGDIIFFNPTTRSAIELSSMGIRVDEEALLKQTRLSKTEDRLEQDYHKSLLAGDLPYTIGGGIGQSRICLFFLEKYHIGEVQVGVWPEDMLLDCQLSGYNIL